MKIAILKYNAGNIQSVAFALARLGISPIITDDAEIIRQSDKVIFPGVGEASSTMKYLNEKGLDKLIPALRQPVLGICLGMQLMCSFSEEGETPCLGIFDELVQKLAVMEMTNSKIISWIGLQRFMGYKLFDSEILCISKLTKFLQSSTSL